MTYHSRTRFATRKSGVEALKPFRDTASLNIILSRASGRRILPSISSGTRGFRELAQELDIGECAEGKEHFRWSYAGRSLG